MQNNLSPASVATEARARGDQLGGDHPKDNAPPIANQARPNGNGAGINIPKHTKRRRNKAAMTGIRAAIKELLEESHPQTVRQIYYALSVRGLIGKTETEYKMTVVRLLVEMREKGEIPFEWIADHTRATYGPNAYGSLAEYAQCQVFVFCEKDALAAVQRGWRLARRWSPGRTSWHACPSGEIVMGDFLLRLRPKKNVSAIHALRRGLKFLLRSCGLRAVNVEEIPERSGLRAGAPSPASQCVKDTNSNE